MTGRLIYVMGPSGAGKDSLLEFARKHLMGEPILFAHRYITRPSGNGEAHVALSVEEFAARSVLGLFALEWSSHSLRYGIGVEIDVWLARGCTVVVNGSRQHLQHVLARYPNTEVVHVNAAPHILEARLGARARESAEQVAARLARRAPFSLPDGVRCTTIDNSGALDAAGHVLIAFLKGGSRRSVSRTIRPPPYFPVSHPASTTRTAAQRRRQQAAPRNDAEIVARQHLFDLRDTDAERGDHLRKRPRKTADHIRLRHQPKRHRERRRRAQQTLRHRQTVRGEHRHHHAVREVIRAHGHDPFRVEQSCKRVTLASGCPARMATTNCVE